MSEARHSRQTIDEGIHIIHAFEYVNTTARDAATYSAADEGKAARVGASAPYDFYVLTNATGPAWVQIGAGGGGGQTDTVAGSSGITNVGTNVDADLAPTYGTTASTICEGNDTRLSDARTPTAHAASHQDGGSDEVATATPAAAAIPKADVSGTLDSWISAASETVAGIMETATAAEVDTGTDAGRAVSPSSLAGSTLASDVATNNAKVTNATHTGEVTGSGALTITADAVTNAKLADVATGTFKGRVTAATGDPEDLTGTQATTLLDPFTSALQGVVPGSGGGTANFLRADGTWTAPPGGGGGEANTASNVNTAGVGVFKQKTGVDLEFRGVKAASAKATVVLDAGTNEIRVDVADASATQAGAIEIADQAEVDTGTDTTRAIVPSTLAGSALAADVATNTAKVSNATHTGDVTGATALTIAANAVTLAKMATLATARFLGRVTAGVGDPEAMTGTQATTLLDQFTSVLQGLVPGSGGGTANFLRADGAWAAPPGAGGITGPGSSVDRGRVVWNGTGGTAIDDTGLRDYGASATDPVSPVPADGDTYRNTALDMQMYYDGARTKWLSSSAEQIAFGRAGNVGAGAYYRGIDRRSFSASKGRDAEHNGTVVAISYTRNDTDAATFEVTAAGAAIATLASSATSGSSSALNGDFAQGQVLGARNQSGGNTTSQVMGWATIRWRA
ncbi:MAG: hypothetical protein HRU00_16945 [Myxococcales bacterium]|nr:hypothetical protein [Myxococcales bacterium]